MEQNSSLVDDSGLDKDPVIDSRDTSSDIYNSTDPPPKPSDYESDHSKSSTRQEGNKSEVPSDDPDSDTLTQAAKNCNSVPHSFNMSKLKNLHITDLPIETDYDTLYRAFKKFGKIVDIRMSPNDEVCIWDAWLSFDKPEEAFEAICNITNIKIYKQDIKGALCEHLPNGLDIYRPSDWDDKTPPIKAGAQAQRKVKPPMWITAATKDNSNYFKTSKFLQKKVGSIKSSDISRFGRNCVLIHAKSKTQSYMLLNLKTDEDEIKLGIKPHLNFSYGRGVVFNRDLYDFTEEEILNMCPKEIWKVSKVPRTSMVVLTFDGPEIPSYIVIENERLEVKPFRQKPLQCFKCYKFGHPCKVCKNDKICEACSGIH